MYIRAIDPFSGKKVWDLPAPAGRSGVLSTAGGLIFLGGGGGLLVVDAKTGKPLWNVNISQTTQGSPMTFMVGGKQYIALAGTAAPLPPTSSTESSMGEQGCSVRRADLQVSLARSADL